MTKLFRLRKREEETWVEYQIRTSSMARKIWVQIKLLFLYEKIADSMWRAMEWACDDKEIAVIFSLKKVFKWRSSTWWQSLNTRMMKEDPKNRTRWKRKWGGTIVDMCGTRWPRVGQVRKTG